MSTIAVELFIFPIAVKDFFLALAIDFQKVGINQINKEEHRKLSGYSLNVGRLAVAGYIPFEYYGLTEEEIAALESGGTSEGTEEENVE